MQVLLVAVVGVIAGYLLALMLRNMGHGPQLEEPPARLPSGRIPTAILEQVEVAAVAVDASDQVVLANRAARRMGVVQSDRIQSDELRQLVRRVRRDGVSRDQRITFTLDQLPPLSVPGRARAMLVGGGEVAVIVEDMTEPDRVEAVRRDFVANMGHEIKTPVGALALLAEAALDARDDPEAVQHFLSRLSHEANRLGRLVTELIDLSRLQGGEPLPKPRPVKVDHLLDEAVDRARAGAEAKGIAIVRGGQPGCIVAGSEPQLVTAVANLLDNAVAYSDEGTRVAVGVRRLDRGVEISVTDQGIGIDPADQHRIFERFYRVDPARSRLTGGTGLGLAIVKHIAGNHGGEVRVWSTVGAGSTFTLRLPAAPAKTAVTAPRVPEEMGA